MNTEHRGEIRSNDKVLQSLASPDSSAFRKYQDFFVGNRSLSSLLGHELSVWFAGPMPGALGYLFRKWSYSMRCAFVGGGVQWGRNVVLRHASKMRIGAGTAFDDGCHLDARGTDADGFAVGRSVLVARGAFLHAKAGSLEIGDGCCIGPQSYVGSAGGIRFGKRVMVGGQCYVGGGRYDPNRTDVPVAEQDPYSHGPVVLEDDVFLGANVTVLDGVTIGRGCFVGAGAVIQESLPADTIVAPYQKHVFLPRKRAEAPEEQNEA